jgi:hypothetical protein
VDRWARIATLNGGDRDITLTHLWLFIAMHHWELWLMHAAMLDRHNPALAAEPTTFVQFFTILIPPQKLDTTYYNHTYLCTLVSPHLHIPLVPASWAHGPMGEPLK